MKKIAAKTSEEYLANTPEPARSTLTTVRASIRSLVPPGTVETISYGMPAFRYDGRTLVWFAAFSKHCSLFAGVAAVVACADDLSAFKTLKGTVQFPIDRPLSKALIKKLLRVRMLQNESKRRA